MTLAYNELQSYTVNRILPKVVDNVHNSAAAVKRMTSSEKMELYSGGKQIQVPVFNEKNNQIQWYNPSDTLASAEQDMATSAINITVA